MTNRRLSTIRAIPCTLRASVWIVLATVVCFQPAIAQKPAVPAPELVIIDTDIGDDIDDVLAVSLAVSSPELKILGVTSAWGDTALRSRLLDRLLHEVGRNDIQVGTGVVKHRVGEAEFSQARWAEREPMRPHSSSVDLILREVAQHPNEITLIAVAPLTNLAAAYDRDPQAFKALKRIVMMGGSVRRGYGDVGYAPDRGPQAEYNIAMDIEAAKKVFASGVPIYMMPLDSTQLKLDEVKRQILFTRSSNLTDILTLLYMQWSRVTMQQTPTVFDAMAVAYAIKPGICPATRLRIRIDDLGYTREESGIPNVSVCLQSDSDAFFTFFMPRILNYGSNDRGELNASSQ